MGIPVATAAPRAAQHKTKAKAQPIESPAEVLSKNKTPASSAKIRTLVSWAMANCKKSSTGKCFRYVKLALQKSGLVNKYLSGESAKNAGPGLLAQGFKKLSVKNPYKAPIGAVLVYSGGAHGHIEIRTSKGFVSDYFSPAARTGASESGVGRGRKLIGVYFKS